MTQLTRSEGPAFDREQNGSKSRSPSPAVLCEGCASIRMARVRRGSQSNRRRQGSERSDNQQSVQSGGQGGNFQLPSLQQAVSYATPLGVERPYYHHVTALPQLETSGWVQNASTFQVTRSPEAFSSTGSPANSSLGVASSDSRSFSFFDRNRALSPSEITPAQSTASLDQSEVFDEFNVYLQGPGRGDSVEDALLDRGTNYS